jgi:hypothetical protein
MTISPNSTMNFDLFINKKVYQIISNHKSHRSLFIVTYSVFCVLYNSRRTSKGGTITGRGKAMYALGMARQRTVVGWTPPPRDSAAWRRVYSSVLAAAPSSSFKHLTRRRGRVMQRLLFPRFTGFLGPVRLFP